MHDPLDDSLPPAQGQLQLDTLRNNGLPPGNDSSGPQITATPILEEADHDYPPPGHDFDDWSMDIDGEGDGGFLGDERTQAGSEDEEDTNEEDIEDLMQILTIDSGEESPCEDEEDDDSEDEASDELEDLDDRMDNRTDDDEAASIRLLLLTLKELSGISHQSFKANT
jgi:hypothetical protein